MALEVLPVFEFMVFELELVLVLVALEEAVFPLRVAGLLSIENPKPVVVLLLPETAATAGRSHVVILFA